ncbi:MAG: dCTP deaminase [Endomicrobium sp.]|uniref:dCTP deaminase n=1 Tax=Candidatus Endomicrobiellum pyrsonymphae TaxID=1408203 RepID=UPI00357CFD21|nr:dCTP deaminase [Endomicrobium sp.]
MVKNDKWIKKMALERKMIEPFEAGQVKNGKISFGTSSYGYDMRLSNEFMVMKKNSDLLDPKQSQDGLFESVTVKDYIEIPRNSVILGKTVEYFRIPRDIITIAFGKSTYARCGIFVNITPFEPEWEGFVTLSIANITSVPVKVYVNEGIAQVLFLDVSEVCEVSYADRKGKYQAQKTIAMAKI